MIHEKKAQPMNSQTSSEIWTTILLIYAETPEEVLLQLPNVTKEDIEMAKEELWRRWVRT